MRRRIGEKDRDQSIGRPLVGEEGLNGKSDEARQEPDLAEETEVGALIDLFGDPSQEYELERV